MLTQVDVRTDSGTLLQLPLEDYSEGVLVKDITGLDPVAATIVSSSFAQLDGEQYQTARREKRNIVFTLGLESDYSSFTVRQIRSSLYKFFMPKSNVNMTFNMDDGPALQISGRVESFAAPLFTKDPEATLSLLCFDPNFVDPNVVTVEGNTTDSTNNDQIEYDGTVETGFQFHMVADRDIAQFSIYAQDESGSQTSLDFDAALSSGDTIDISTVAGAKSARLTRDGAQSSILYGVSPFSAWVNLFPGVNQFRVQAAGDPVPYTLSYTNKYGGL